MSSNRKLAQHFRAALNSERKLLPIQRVTLCVHPRLKCFAFLAAGDKIYPVRVKAQELQALVATILADRDPEEEAGEPVATGTLQPEPSIHPEQSTPPVSSE